ncbi:MAG: hypothetical protein LC776_07335 [Acidobacteria bacterium]|nr:hypothetical protein [Acidobacteriota bacterium]
MSDPTAPAGPALSTVRQFCERYPAFTPGGLRWLIFNERQNGMSHSGVIVRVGRKVLIHEPRFFTWLDAQNA